MNEENNQQNSVGQEVPKLNDGHKNTIMAVLSYIGPLVIIPYFTVKGDSFVKFHIKQGIVLLIVWIIIWFTGMVLWQFWMIMNLLNLLAFILMVIGIINVLQGRERNLPFVGKFVKYLNF